MKRAVDQKNSRLIATCASAAEQLDVSERFVEAYLQHVFAFDGQTRTQAEQWKISHVNTMLTKPSPALSPAPSPSSISPLSNSPDLSPLPSSDTVLEPFRLACRDSVSVVCDHGEMVLKSFSDPRKPLATILSIIANRKVLSVAESIFSSLIESIRASEQRQQDLKSFNGDAVRTTDFNNSRRRSSLERMRSLAISDSKEKWRDHAQRVSDERRRYLIAVSYTHLTLPTILLV